MRHTGAAVRLTEGEVDVLVCPARVASLILEAISTREEPAEDGWYAFMLVEHEEDNTVGTALVPIDNLPTTGVT